MSKDKFNAKQDYLILKAVAREKTDSGISVPFRPQGQTIQERWGMIKHLKVVAVGDEVKGNYKVGDYVFIKGHVFNQVCPSNHIGQGETKKDEQNNDLEQYYWTKEEDIIGITKY